MKTLKSLIMLFAVTLLTGVFAAPENNAEVHKETLKDEFRFRNTLPPEVKTVALLTPASYPGGKVYARAIELLKKAGYKLKVMPHAFTKPEGTRSEGKYHAPLNLRLQDFYAAWNDPEVDMIISLRGGRGCDDLIRNLDWTKLKKRPELRLQGFSDVTLLLCAMLKYDNGHPVAGPLASSLPGLKPRSIREMADCHNNRPIGPLNLTPLVPGDCKGLPLAGLAMRFEVAIDSGYCPDVTGRIIFMECVGRPITEYRRCLKRLIELGFFKKAAGVVFCHYTRAEGKAKARALYKELAPEFGVPVYCGFPFGHSSECFTIDFRRPVEIKNHKIYFPAVK